MRRYSGISLMLAVFSVACHGQNNCSEFLRHGLYDYFRSGNSNASAASIHNKICTANSSQASSSGAGNAGINAIGIGSANGSFNQAQTTAVTSAMCNVNSSDSAAQQQLDNYSAVIDPAAVSAFQECVRLQSAGIHVNFNIDESTLDTVVVGLFLSTNPGTTGNARITDIQIDMPNDNAPDRQMTCSGGLWRAVHDSGNAALTVDSLGMTCKRPIIADAHNAIYVAGHRVLAAPVRLTIITSAGNVTTQLQPIPAPDMALESPVPIGAIIDWFGLPGAPSLPTNFIICDGRPIPSGPMAGQMTPKLNGSVTIGESQAQLIGSTGGRNFAAVTIPAHSHHLITGQAENALRVQDGPGVMLHTTTADFLVNSITDEAGAYSSVFPIMPPFMRVYKVMRFQ